MVRCTGPGRFRHRSSPGRALRRLAGSPGRSGISTSMDSTGGLATTETPQTQRNQAGGDRPSLAMSPGTILLVSIWIGLIAGMLDLGLLITRNRMGDRDFYHLGEDFVWIIPAGVTALVLIPGTLIAMIAGIRREVSVHVWRSASSVFSVSSTSARGSLSISGRWCSYPSDSPSNRRGGSGGIREPSWGWYAARPRSSSSPC